jgi:hypothetical protein
VDEMKMYRNLTNPSSNVSRHAECLMKVPYVTNPSSNVSKRDLHHKKFVIYLLYYP